MGTPKCYRCEIDNNLAEAGAEMNYYQDALEALKKQIPKKADEYLTSSFCCPVCTNVLSRHSIYCDNCGQALDWGDTE